MSVLDFEQDFLWKTEYFIKVSFYNLIFRKHRV